jgi:protein-disulfide isomerase
VLAAALVTALLAACTACGERGGDNGEAGTRAATQAPDYVLLEQVPERLDEDGTTITVGDPAARLPLRLYEDPRCPYCKEYETTGGGPVAQARLLSRDIRIDYTLASFLDDRLGGGGSARAVNALRAALEEDKFAEFHQVLYAHQPEESVDGFTEERLLQLAGQVDGLRGPEFDEAVRTMKYRDFVAASEKAYEEAGGAESPQGPGTPTMLTSDDLRRAPQDALYDPEAMQLLLLSWGVEDERRDAVAS